MTNPSHNCPHCGKRLARPDAAFCTNCGAPLRGDGGQTVATVHGGSLAKIIVHLPGEESREEFLSKAITTLGRRRSNMIQVLSPIVSGEHAQIELTRKGHTITDLHSTNGTYVNGKRLTPGKPHLLTNNNIIRFSDGMGNSASLTYVAPSLFADVEAVDITQVFQLAADISYIGRNPDAAITLDHPAVSWYHAKVVKRDEQRYTIQDLSSNNGTFLNGSQLRQERVLERGDVVQIGPFNLVYRDQGVFAPFSAERNFRLEAVDLEKTFYAANLLGRQNKNKAITVLRNLNLVINPREFVALVGGSGTGKSTLMKALSGLSPATSGTVLVNGDNLYENFNLYRNMMGYVPQDDIIHEGLAVHNALFYAASLRLPDASPPEIEERITEVLAKVGLTAQAHSLVRNLSGGQRKRVSIAAELLAEPWIFFLDEPTSGLDPGLEKLMMDTLRQLADEGRTIVLVTHATVNITNNCDQVAFMARGGELTYFGPPDQAIAFFNVKDFSDIYTRLSQTFTLNSDPTVPAQIKTEYDHFVSTHHVDTPQPPGPTDGETRSILAGPLWAAHYRQTPTYQTYIANRQTGEMARPLTATAGAAEATFISQIKQFGVLAQRYLDLIRHDKISLWVLLAIMPIIGIFLLLISDGAALVGNTVEEIAAILDAEGAYTIVNKAQTLLFMMALSANLLGVFAAAYEIIKEEAIYRRERMINLRIFPYYASKFVVLGAFMLLQCLLLLIVLALGIDFPGGGAILWSPLEYYFTLVFTALASVALGLFISALATSRNTVIYLILIVLFIQIVFSGAIFELSPFTQPLSYLTITRWSLEALGASTNMDALNNLGQVRVEREIDIGRGVQKVVEDAPTTMNFYVNYAHNGLALLSRWIFLIVHTVLWSGLAIWLIGRKDEI
ncbi:MAG: FHA domain-containing protein [Anaerolineae bacterium]|nr:FHA domain-containing protein [Anaerolineae bacterium]